MRITQIITHNFLYKFNYTIDLNQIEHITIIHGPNGSGKTFLLKFLDFLFHKKFWDLRKIPFQTVRIIFDSGEEFRVYSTFFQMVKEYHTDKFIEKFLTCGNINDRTTLYFEIRSQKEKDWIRIFSLQEYEFKEIILPKILDEKEVLKQKDLINKYLIEYPDDRKNIRLSYEKISFQLESRGKIIDKKTTKKFKGIPEPIERICHSIPIKFIQNQRIISYDSKKDNAPFNEILKCSKDLKKFIESGQKVINEENKKFKKSIQAKLWHFDKTKKIPSIGDLKVNLKDRSDWFLERLYWELPYPVISESFPYFDIDIKKYLNNISFENQEYQTLVFYEIFLDFLDGMIHSIEKFDTKIFLFQFFLQNDFINKEIVISNQGLELIFDHDSSSEFFPLNLSSGEQHIFIILFSLLFKVKSGTLVLIDEPEISLHIHWQRKFLRILQKIIADNPIDIFIATHAPDIVFDRRDLSISLKGD